jgi:hypothetical protein
MPFTSVTFLSKTFTLTASGVNPPGTVQLKVGVVPAPEMVTLTGKGTGAAGMPVNVGVVARAVSVPLVKVRLHAPVRAELNAGATAQKFALTANPAQGVGPTVNPPWTPVIVVNGLGMTSAPNWFRSP